MLLFFFFFVVHSSLALQPASHRRTGRGGARGLQPPQNLGCLNCLGSKRNLGKVNFYRSLHVCVRVVVVFFLKIDIFYFKLKSA